ncbi:hypothetical protein SPRG_12239 [Saprolegnia parasitica CBS 223.65]|uniref:Uncharacterized protein n=1 Tax=Saprolegnia parasitica (strain CBS 223.65) TaxID=695850 RepID=A0A067BYU3_SAPPC|nr:hypothetical protein SPRG_12239 [Saprolegnia parasitica CBS 223.65]KDO22030.1 hypothetical protein SPRG_12239 [Saprolegnia parasitica CBS 223.65]|eukprot:XP_012207273.1 hypothetical protein SPRG_12239 [Saprolegnia parasitica CBS 223.65]
MSRLVVLTPESSPARLSTDSIALLASPPRRSCGRWRLLHLSSQGTAASRSIDSSRHDELDKVDDGVHALRRKRKLVLSLIALALVIVAISLAVIFTQANGRADCSPDSSSNTTSEPTDDASTDSIAYHNTDYGTDAAFDPSNNANANANANCVAYLFEVSRNGGKTWYDISVIPPGCGDGTSWDACSRGGTVAGYNVPLSVRPARVVSEAGYNCVDVQCASEQCPDAYLFPSDNVKTKSCSIDEVLVATWC